MSISHAGHLIASGQRGDNSDILLWDYENKKAIYRLSEHDYEISCLEFSHDDRLLISSGNTLDGKMFIWDTTNGYIVASKQIVPHMVSEAPLSIKFGGFVKDVKLRDTTNYQFSVSSSSKLMMWSLEPSNGNLEVE